MTTGADVDRGLSAAAAAAAGGGAGLGDLVERWADQLAKDLSDLRGPPRETLRLYRGAERGFNLFCHFCEVDVLLTTHPVSPYRRAHQDYTHS